MTHIAKIGIVGASLLANLGTDFKTVPERIREQTRSDKKGDAF
jgi:hypothetical protein